MRSFSNRYLLSLIIVVSCKNHEVSNHFGSPSEDGLIENPVSLQKKSKLDIQSNGYLTIIDSSSLLPKDFYYKNFADACYYPIYYVGQQNDTFHLSKEPLHQYGFDREYDNPELLPSPDNNNFKIIVDTSIRLNYITPYMGFFDGLQNNADSTKAYTSFPIFMSNLSDSLLILTFCWDIRNIIRQTKNRNGQWVDYDIPERIWCGTGCQPIVLKPHQILISKLLRFTGNHKVKSRLKFISWRKPVYSNTFYDYIDMNKLSIPTKKQ